MARLTVASVLLWVIIPLVFLAGGVLLWRLLRPRLRYETPFGVLRREYFSQDFFKGRWVWLGELKTDDYASLALWAEDCDGTPTPALMSQLPHILRELPEWERKARAHVAELTDDFTFNSLIDESDNLGPALSLSFCPKATGRGIYIVFRDGDVIGRRRLHCAQALSVGSILSALRRDRRA